MPIDYALVSINLRYRRTSLNLLFNNPERRDITISLLNDEHAPVVVWKVKNAWATKIQSTDLKADGNEVAIESMELVHEGLEIQND